MYSQNLEEKYIEDFFGYHVGTFLDLGSYTGIELSNVRLLAERNWSGVMIEASPTVFEVLKKNYEGFTKIELHNIAIGPCTGVLDFYDNHNAVGTLHKHETERWGNTEQFNKIQVPCIEINEFLDSITMKTFDFLSCDIEGEDKNVLMRMDLIKMGVKLLCVEWNSKNKEDYDIIVLPQGFNLIHQNAENLIYAK